LATPVLSVAITSTNPGEQMVSAERAAIVGSRLIKILLQAASADHVLKKDLDRFLKPLRSLCEQRYDFRKPDEVQRKSVSFSGRRP
jgi:tryptophan synthase alpha subunit